MVAPMTLDPSQLPDDVASLKAIVIAANKRVLEADARAKLLDAEIENLKLTIAKLQHQRFGPSSERARLIDQLELQLGELVELTAQDATAEEIAAQIKVNAEGQQQDTTTRSQQRRKPARRPLPANLPRERRVQPAPSACPCCGGNNLRKVGEDVTETLERVPAHWKVIENVTEKFSCRACESMSQAPAPSHPIARGRAGPHLLAEV